MHYLLRFNPQARLLILATLRSEELTDEHPVQGLLTTLGREGLLTKISLEAPSRDETASLATQTAGHDLSPEMLSQLYQDTEGVFVANGLPAASPHAQC